MPAAYHGRLFWHLAGVASPVTRSENPLRRPRGPYMKDKQEIVSNWLPRYTGTPLEQFGQYILLTNFGHYVDLFAEWHGVEVQGRDRPMPNATADGITLVNFGMGSPNAATVMDLLGAIAPKAALFLASAAG